MSEHKTISTRWREWAEKEWYWAYPCLCSFVGSVICLGVHLWFLHGPIRIYGLIGMISLATITTGILWLRKQWWWLSFHTYIVVGVIGWEIASYFFGGK